MKEIARWLIQFEIPLLAFTYLYFILSDQLPLVAAALIGLVWAARFWLTRKLTVRTALDLPILLILLMLPMTLWVSSNWSLSLPKIYGLLLSVAFYYTLVNHIDAPRDVMFAQVGLGLLCLVIAIAGLVGTDWVQSKIVSASFIYDRLPRVIQTIPRSIAGGFARNGIGGTLTFTIPFLAAMIFSVIGNAQNNGAIAASKKISRSARNDNAEAWFPRIVIAALVLSIVTLALTQSRGGILGTMVGLTALIVWKKSSLGLSIIAAGALIIIVLVALGYGNGIANFLFKTDSADSTLASRLEVWQRGVMMVQDFPFTGIGIGTFNVVAHALYPFFIAAPNELVPHAHNQFLEVTIDLGIPGLVAYIAMLIIFAMCAIRAYRSIPNQKAKALIVGLSFGMLAHHVFGLTDAFILGSKPGLLMWIYFAMVAACYGLRKEYVS